MRFYRCVSNTLGWGSNVVVWSSESNDKYFRFIAAGCVPDVLVECRATRGAGFDMFGFVHFLLFFFAIYAMYTIFPSVLANEDAKYSAVPKN